MKTTPRPADMAPRDPVMHGAGWAAPQDTSPGLPSTTPSVLLVRQSWSAISRGRSAQAPVARMNTRKVLLADS
jgi:hypothetical protein